MFARWHRFMLAALTLTAAATVYWLGAAVSAMGVNDDGAWRACAQHPDRPAGGSDIDGEYSLLPPGLYCHGVFDGRSRQFLEPSWTDTLLPTAVWSLAALAAAVTIAVTLWRARPLLPSGRFRLAVALLVTAYALATGLAVALIALAPGAFVLLPVQLLVAVVVFIGAEAALQPALDAA